MCIRDRPCTGTVDREFICEEIIAMLSDWRAKFPSCGWVLSGDFNAVLPSIVQFQDYLINFYWRIIWHVVMFFPCHPEYTFANESQGLYSKLDYVTFCDVKVISFMVHDSVTNLSDHLPLIAVFDCPVNIERVL